MAFTYRMTGLASLLAPYGNMDAIAVARHWIPKSRTFVYSISALDLVMDQMETAGDRQQAAEAEPTAT